MSQACEYNFDGLIGPTHNFAGQAVGNVAAVRHKFQISHPRAAALQGLAKMELLLDLGLPQGFIPPQERPELNALRRLGFSGSDAQVLDKAWKKSPALVYRCSSASAMWVANAATVSPSADTPDGRVHFTPANLVTHPHRAVETPQTAFLLRQIFNDEKYFVHHRPLAMSRNWADEGAANHLRLSGGPGEPGIEVFVYGEDRQNRLRPKRFPARQTLAASEQVSRLHRLSRANTVFSQQNPAAIEQGVFHNDVVAVSNENVLLYHQQAFRDETAFTVELLFKFTRLSRSPFFLLKVSPEHLSLKQAVATYFFNSQIVTVSRGRMVIIAPQESGANPVTRGLLNELCAGKNPIHKVYFTDLRESMANGGGPACLRLRVVLTPAQVQGVNPGYLLNRARLTLLKKWVKKHYRERMHVQDLRDVHFLKESRQALDELTDLLSLGRIYSFQR